MKKALFVLFLFFFLAIGIAGFWYYQERIFSKEILKLEILGPDKVTLGEEIEYLVKYKNNGNIRLEEARLIFEYPKYSLIEEGNLRKEIGLEDIYPGEEKTFSFKARLLGKEGEAKQAKAWLSYRPKNLQARFEAATSHTVVISQAPLNLEFDLPSKIESGKEIRFRLNYFSNVDFPLSNLRIKTEYPSGFEFQKAIPSALDATEWEISLLNKAEGGRIEITGILKGELKEIKIFKALLGIWKADEFVLLKESIRGVEIAKPALYIFQQINGNPKYVANPGDLLHYEIFFKNIGPETLENLFLVVNLEGKAFDFQTIKTASGGFRPGDNSIIFDWRNISELKVLLPQGEGMVEFWVELKKDWEISGPEDKNPVIRNKVSLFQAQEEFLTKVNSKLEILQKGFFSDEVFGNSGSIPPRVGETTTYTIIWQAKNYFNDVKDVKVKATLAEGVKLSGRIFPENARLTFDSKSREIIWEIGDLEAGQGVLNLVPNVAFQIAFTPTLDQRGQKPYLISEAKISGVDQWTEMSIEGIAPAIDTTLPDDETITENMGIVQ